MTRQADPFNSTKSFNSYNPFQHVTVDALIANWDNLAAAIKKGAKQYSDARNYTADEATTGLAAFAGLVHGDEGRRRAKALQELQIPSTDHLKLFALLYAVFAPNVKFYESRSSWLAMCIAEELIKGNFQRTTVYGLGNEQIPEGNTLTSDIFSKNVLEVTTSDPAALNVLATDSFSNTTYIKPAGVRSFLIHARKNLSDAERNTFDSQVAFFKKELVKKPNPASFESAEMRTFETPLRSH